MNSSGRPPERFHVVDTHAHMSAEVFDGDRDAVLERARSAGVRVIVTVSEDLDDARRNLALAERYEMFRPAVGLYPGRLESSRLDDVAALIRSSGPRLIAIGEVGLDYWTAKTEPERHAQRQAFRRFIALARELELPLNVHSRSAGRQVIELLLETGARHVHMHAFDGRACSALPAVEAGYYFSIPPSIVRSRQKQKLVSSLPLSCLLLETDSPVLGPIPGERNEPANIGVAAQAIAQIKGIRVEQVYEAASQNTEALYGLPGQEELC